MRALILAAGIGSRLHPLTNNLPKCLVNAGEKPLIQHQIDALHSCGVEDIVLVIGYQAPQVREHLGTCVRYVENDQFRTTNSLYSLYLAREELDTDLFLFNCDILFHDSVLRRMLDSPFANVVAVDSRTELTANEMNVTTDAKTMHHQDQQITGSGGCNRLRACNWPNSMPGPPRPFGRKWSC